MKLVKRTKVGVHESGKFKGRPNGLLTPVYDEELGTDSIEDGDKKIADNAIEVTVGANTYVGNTVARSLMVDLIVKDLSAPTAMVSLQGMTVPVADVVEAHNKATLEAQIIFG